MSSPTLQTLSSVGERTFLLLSHQKKLHVVEIANGAAIARTQVPAGMWLSTAYTEGDTVRVALAARQGKTHLLAPGSAQKGKSVTIPTAGTGPDPKRGYVGDLRTIGGRPTLVGTRAQLYVWDGTSWTDERASLLQSVDVDLSACPIRDAIDVEGEPALLFDRDRDHSQTFVRRSGRWLAHGLIGTANAIAWRASDATLFAVGEHVWAIPFEGGGLPRDIGPAPTKLWAAAVFREQLFVSNLNCVYALRGDRFEEVLGLGESGAHNHSLSSYGDRLYLVRRTALEIFDGRTWTTIPSGAFV